MVGTKKIRQEVKKEFNWYGSIAVPKEINKPRAFARLQSLQFHLLDDSVLRVNGYLRLFVVGNVVQGMVSEDERPAIRKVSKDVETTTFVQLQKVENVRDIISVRHQIHIDKVSYRAGRLSVIGAMTLIVAYLSDVVLDGTVIEFSTGKPVKGATVTIKDIDSGELLISTVTGADGGYAFADIDPGTFMVEVKAEGFQQEERVAVVMLKDTVDFILHKVYDEAPRIGIKNAKKNLGTENLNVE